MNKHSILFIGLDTHKEFNEVAYIEEHRGAKPVHLGRVSSSKVAVQSLFVSLNLNTLAQRYTLFMKQALVVIGFTD